MQQSYRVPFAFGEGEFVEKKSRFIGRIWPCESQEEALDHIKQMKSRHWDATHNVYAYILREGGVMRYSDDGEPQGTAGMPVLEVLRREEITNVCCVVTRYFGGTLLGAGGLTRAYAKGAKIALDAAGVAEMDRYCILEVACPYALLGAVQNLLPGQGAQVQDTQYGAEVTLRVTIRQGQEDELNRALMDASAGRVQGEVVEKRYMGRKLK